MLNKNTFKLLLISFLAIGQLNAIQITNDTTHRLRIAIEDEQKPRQESLDPRKGWNSFAKGLAEIWNKAPYIMERDKQTYRTINIGPKITININNLLFYKVEQVLMSKVGEELYSVWLPTNYSMDYPKDYLNRIIIKEGKDEEGQFLYIEDAEHPEEEFSDEGSVTKKKAKKSKKENSAKKGSSSTLGGFGSGELDDILGSDDEEYTDEEESDVEDLILGKKKKAKPEDETLHFDPKFKGTNPPHDSKDKTSSGSKKKSKKHKKQKSKKEDKEDTSDLKEEKSGFFTWKKGVFGLGVTAVVGYILYDQVVKKNSKKK